MARIKLGSSQRWVLFVLIVFVIYSFARFPRGRQQNLIGQQAPNIQFTWPEGKKTSIFELRGEVLLLNFWASWCYPCMQEMPDLRRLEDALEDKGFRLLAFNISEETPKVLKKYKASELPRDLIFRFDQDSLQSYQVSAIPLSILIDRQGVIRKVYWGPRKWGSSAVQNEISALL